jgi:hypothetical protein
MTAAAMMTTMIRMMRNMALAPLGDLLGTGRWAAGPRRLLLNLHWKFITGNLVLELTIDEEPAPWGKEEVPAS